MMPQDGTRGVKVKTNHPKHCNRLAHESAKLVNPECVIVEWRTEIPLALRGIIESDCNSTDVQ